VVQTTWLACYFIIIIVYFAHKIQVLILIVYNNDQNDDPVDVKFYVPRLYLVQFEKPILPISKKSNAWSGSVNKG